MPDDGAADFTTFLSSGGLGGVRLGVLRRYFGGLPALDQLMEDSLTALRDAGAVLVDPVDIITAPKLGAPEFEVLLYEFKDGINRYLAARGATTKYHTLAELIEFNRANAAKEMPWFGQETFELAEKKGPLSDAGVSPGARGLPPAVPRRGHRRDAQALSPGRASSAPPADRRG